MKNARFNLRIRLTLLVAAEILVSLLLAQLASELLSHLFPALLRNIPRSVELIVFSLVIAIASTGFLSKLFFVQIRKLQDAMKRVADGDFSIRLPERSSSQEIRQLYSSFNVMTRELAATELLQSDFVANVSHEFKTPITAIEGYATLLQDEHITAQERNVYIEKILFNTARLSGLVGNILLLSKLENQSITPTVTDFRLDEQIRACLVHTEPQWSGLELDLDVDLSRVDYRGSEGLLSHVWDNLISNAIKFNRPGGLLRLSLTRMEDHVLFRIENDGEPLTEKDCRHLFDKFYQADSSHRQKGNGLGLPLVKRICTLVGAQIEVQSRPSGGAIFTIRLPAA